MGLTLAGFQLPCDFYLWSCLNIPELKIAITAKIKIIFVEGVCQSKSTILRIKTRRVSACII